VARLHAGQLKSCGSIPVEVKTAPRPAIGPLQPPIELCWGLAEVMYVRSSDSTLPCIFMGGCLINHMESFIFLTTKMWNIFSAAKLELIEMYPFTTVNQIIGLIH
jgi:hypothetical protein